jgi:CubicO group peptidase (beta-lactamase class C family)
MFLKIENAMKKSLPLIFILLFACCSWSKTDHDEKAREGEENSHKDHSSAIKFTEQKLRNIMRKKHLPALAVAIVDNHDIIYRESFGMADIENRTEASDSTVFKLWSLAKVFTAIEIFREVEEGLIDLDDSILKYIPEFTIHSRYDDNKNITVKSILAHRSGLPRNECVPVHDDKQDTCMLEKFERATSDCFTAFPVGYRYKYSNLGYDILGRIIEENRNEGFSDFMQKNLLFKLGMNNSSFRLGDLSRPEQVAKGYEYYKHNYYPMIQPDINSVPSGNLFSTIEDLSVFLKSVISNEVFNNEETIYRMFTDYYSRDYDPETMGLGWKTTKINGTELMVWHDGGPAEGIGAIIAILPYKKLGIALVANSTSFESSISVPFAVEILEHVLETKSDIEYYPSEKPEKMETNIQLLNSYEGKYAAFGQIMELKVKNNRLKGKIGRISLNIIPVSETQFIISHWMDKIGLTKIFKPPIEFNKIKIEFSKSNSPDSCNMIINLDNISFEVCPKYPVQVNIPGKWDILLGDYQMAERLPGNKTGKFNGRHYNIYKEDSVMVMSGAFGPIVPSSENCLVIASGPFVGETIEYYPESGNIIHQNAIFVPVNRELPK